MNVDLEYINEGRNMLGKGYEHELPPSEVFGKISGYTPTPDVLCRKYGFVTALVWGRMQRFCQGYDRVCRAKLETIAESLGMSERTIIRHIDTLVRDGYFIDKTPDLKNRPHIYADTGKLRLAFSTEVIENGVTESQRTMTESQRQGDRESHEDTIKERIKESYIDPIIKHMQSIGMWPNSSTGIILQAWREQHSDEWIIKALDMSKGKSQNYADKILLGWEANGYPKPREEQVKSIKRVPELQKRPGPAIKELD